MKVTRFSAASADAVPLHEAALAELLETFSIHPTGSHFTATSLSSDTVRPPSASANPPSNTVRLPSASANPPSDAVRLTPEGIRPALPAPVILCIGTDRLIGDSLGPMVGSLLVRSGCPFPVYGTLTSPVHALNLPLYTRQIPSRHPGAPVIAVDASLGPDWRIGCISLRPHGLRPGAGVNKELDPAGDISITGITNTEGQHPYLSLQTARLSTVMEMAEEICACILGVCPHSGTVCAESTVH